MAHALSLPNAGHPVGASMDRGLPAISKATIEHKVTDLVEEVVSVDILESSFNLFLVHRKDVE